MMVLVDSKYKRLPNFALLSACIEHEDRKCKIRFSGEQASKRVRVSVTSLSTNTIAVGSCHCNGYVFLKKKKRFYSSLSQ